jgi:hypothetical protein
MDGCPRVEQVPVLFLLCGTKRVALSHRKSGAGSVMDFDTKAPLYLLGVSLFEALKVVVKYQFNLPKSVNLFQGKSNVGK